MQIAVHFDGALMPMSRHGMHKVSSLFRTQFIVGTVANWMAVYFSKSESSFIQVCRACENIDKYYETQNFY